MEVTTDAGRPAAPVNLTLELIGAGIKALWEAPAGAGETLSYTLYRRSGTTLTDLTGLTPVQRNIVADGQGRLGYIDTHPDKDQAVYAVTAVDSVGNESPPSEAHYLNIDLLPVATLQVRQEDQNPPQIEWSHTGGNIAGYQLYLDDQTTPLTAGLMTGTSYSDNRYNGERRRYRVVAQDTLGIDSIARSVTLPMISAVLSPQSQLKRGVMNRLDYQVKNSDSHPLNGLRLQVEIAGSTYSSAPFNLTPGETRSIPVIVGGADTLPEMVNLTQRLQHTAATGERAEVVRNQALITVPTPCP